MLVRLAHVVVSSSLYLCRGSLDRVRFRAGSVNRMIADRLANPALEEEDVGSFSYLYSIDKIYVEEPISCTVETVRYLHGCHLRDPQELAHYFSEIIVVNIFA